MRAQNTIPGYTGYQPQHAQQSQPSNLLKNKQQTHHYMPGYQGYVPGIKSENLYGESFGKTSGSSVQGNIKRQME